MRHIDNSNKAKLPILAWNGSGVWYIKNASFEPIITYLRGIHETIPVRVNAVTVKCLVQVGGFPGGILWIPTGDALDAEFLPAELVNPMPALPVSEYNYATVARN